MQYASTESKLIKELEIKALQNKFIMHSGVSSIVQAIKTAVESKALLRERNQLMPPDSICLIGEAGAGKTAICEQITSQYPSSIVHDNLAIVEHKPIVSLSVPLGSLKSLASKILSNLGDPNPYKGNTDQMTARIVMLLETAKTNLIILDEFHNLIAGKNHAVIVKWVKTLINDTKVPVMVVGTHEVRTLITQSAEISRRFKILQIDPFDYKFTVQSYPLKVYVNTIANLLSVAYPKISFEGLTNPHTLMRLYLATLGNVSNINTLMINSFIRAMRADVNIVSQENMSQGFAESSIAYVRDYHSKNPFNISDKEAVSLMNKVTSMPR